MLQRMFQQRREKSQEESFASSDGLSVLQQEEAVGGFFILTDICAKRRAAADFRRQIKDLLLLLDRRPSDRSGVLPSVFPARRCRSVRFPGSGGRLRKGHSPQADSSSLKEEKMRCSGSGKEYFQEYRFPGRTGTDSVHKDR